MDRLSAMSAGSTTADRHRRRPAAFTLVEALVAISITAIGAAALLLGISSSLETTNDALEETMAAGMARQLLDEVVGARYYAAGIGDPYQTAFGPSSDEQSGRGRERYDDIDDYSGFRSKPPADPWGVPLGTDDGEGSQRHPSFFAPPHVLDNWQQEIDVYYVDPSDLSTRLPPGQVSDYRVVEVRIVLVDPDRGRRELASARQVVAYVPPTP
jgi:type II secretory pathway pseudopilin PulG